MASGSENHWFARAVNIIRPNKSVIQIERFEPTEIFNNKEEAEAYGLNVAIDTIRRMTRTMM